MNKRARWKLILIIIGFMREATDKQLLNVVQYAAELMAEGNP